MDTQIKTEKHIAYFDGLRVLASIAVMSIHIAAQHWHDTPVASYEWQLFNLWDALSKWAVPVFVMISGALFLGRQQPIKAFYKKYIPRMMTAFLFWASMHALVNRFIYGYGIRELVLAFFDGAYHMWFLYMIVGLYILTPLLRKIVESRTLMLYFLLAACCLTTLLPHIADLLSLVSVSMGGILKTMLEKVEANALTGYVFYYVLGYYLHTEEIPLGKRRLCYLLGVFGAVSAVLGSSLLSLFQGHPNGIFYKEQGPLMLCISAALFVFGKYHFTDIVRSPKLQVWIHKLARASFGAYLSHVLVLILLEEWLGLHTLQFTPLLSMPLLLILVFLLSYLISFFLLRIPVLKKWIV